MATHNNVFVFGSSGYIGSAILKKLRELNVPNFTAGRSDRNNIYIDLSSLDYNFLSDFKAGDYFIFLAAISSPETCSMNYDVAYTINVRNTSVLIENLLKIGVNVLFASSDTVYGRTEFPVTEMDDINPQFAYAKMKAEVEEKFKSRDNFKVMRLSYVWSLSDKFTRFLLKSHEKKCPVEIFDPFIRSVVCLGDVIEFVMKFVATPCGFPNMVNLAGPEFISRVELVEEISKYISIDFNITQPSDDFFKYRPDQILMKSVYLEGVLGRKAHNLSDSIKKEFLAI